MVKQIKWQVWLLKKTAKMYQNMPFCTNVNQEHLHKHLHKNAPCNRGLRSGLAQSLAHLA